jgi:3-oxoacyl-[acyl-carrier-protein] synthase II
MSRGGADRRRVVVTGLGCVSPLGKDTQSTWDAAVAGKSGAAEIGCFDASDIAVRIAAECSSEIELPGVSAKDTRRYDRCMQLALAATLEAVRDAALDLERIDLERLGIAVGTGIGGVNTLLSNHKVMLERGPRRLSPFTVPMALANMPSAVVAMHHGARGPNISPVGACASGAQGIAEAVHAIQRGEADVMIAGGTESAIHPLVVAGFAAMRALSTRNDDPEGASRPFDQGREGFLIAEGAAILVLEAEAVAKRRGARIRSVLLGSGVAADAAHIALPAEDGAGARLAMERALADAALTPEDVDHINAHATSTPAGDQVEAMAIRQVFGDATHTIPVSATKSMTGHLLGAAGALEAIFCIRALEDGVLPPTINLEKADPACALDHVANEARQHDICVALSNAFGFGGINVSLVLGRATT